MKKLTDNTKLGKLILLCNLIVLVLFIISMLFLLKFDTTNKAVIQERKQYNEVYEAHAMSRQPLKQDSAEVAYYQYNWTLSNRRLVLPRMKRKHSPKVLK